MKNITQKIVNIDLNLINKVSNFRLLSSEKNVTGLSLDIAANGLATPLVVHNTGDGTYETIMGHRRTNALSAFLTRDPEGFNKMFAAGIPCIVHSGLTRLEIETLKADSGNTVTLSHPYECQLFCNAQFDNGASMAQTGINAEAILAACHPITDDKVLKDLAAFQAEAERLTAEGRTAAAQAAWSDFEKRYKEARHGKMQAIKAIYDAPHLVMAFYHFTANGVMPSVDSRFYVGKETMPKKWTVGKAGAMAKAFEKDKKEGNYTKANPGPNFLKAWDAWVNEEVAEGVKAIRSKSAKDIKDASTGYLSRTARSVAAYAAGEGVQCGFAQDDLHSAMIELIAENAPELMAMVIAEYNALREQFAATPEAAPVEAETEVVEG